MLITVLAWYKLSVNILEGIGTKKRYSTIADQEARSLVGSYRPNPPRRLVAKFKKALATIFVRGSPNIGPGLICAKGGEPGWKGKGTVGVGEEVPWL